MDDGLGGRWCLWGGSETEAGCAAAHALARASHLQPLIVVYIIL